MRTVYLCMLIFGVLGTYGTIKLFLPAERPPSVPQDVDGVFQTAFTFIYLAVGAFGCAIGGVIGALLGTVAEALLSKRKANNEQRLD